ncbi:TfoX/Sxy family protein [Gemmatimonas sp.]|uniref:TfoX/Sxy family protein n=1 Tax=Gemmatimonas sp. TaxID=1962908 RepID=UPI0039837132
MASDLSFVEYVRDQMHGAGTVTFKKMFGEYALYVDEKVVALVCDNQLFVKPTGSGRAVLGAVTEASPYAGAKPQWLITEQLEDQALIAELIRATAAELPTPKPKSKPKPAKRVAKNPATQVAKKPR